MTHTASSDSQWQTVREEFGDLNDSGDLPIDICAVFWITYSLARNASAPEMISAGPTLGNLLVTIGPESDTRTTLSSMAPIPEAETLRLLFLSFFFRSAPAPGSQLTLLFRQTSELQVLLGSVTSSIFKPDVSTWLPLISPIDSSDSSCWGSSEINKGPER